MHRLAPLTLLVLTSASCLPTLQNGILSKERVAYRVAPLNESIWHSVRFAENDLAWTSRDGHLMAMNATCDNHGDPSLDTLTTHLLFGFSDRNLESRNAEMIDGREALRSRYTAKLDGVPVAIELVVLKKNGCVHDFTFIAPDGKLEMYRADFDGLVKGFHQERAQ